jgi:hypothetical protein
MCQSTCLESTSPVCKPQHCQGERERERERTQINKIRYEKGNITTNANEIQTIIRDYFEDLHSNEL